jgi:hypothetical protein
MSTRSERFRAEAAEARKIARFAIRDDQKTLVLNVARQYERLADEEEEQYQRDRRTKRGPSGPTN